MQRGTKAAAALAIGIVAGAGAALAAGVIRWRLVTARAFARLDAPVVELPPYEFVSEALTLLPAPVQKYFAFALTPGQRIVRRARVLQDGMFRAGGPGAGWSPFTAVQRFATQPPGFVWDARIQAAPLMAVRVRDSYIAGAGAMEANIAALFPIVAHSGTQKLAMGALHRYLAEAVWLPTALLPGQGVEWEAIDDTSARATLTDGAISVSLIFHFGDCGEIVRTYTPERYRDVDGAVVPTPWTCSYDGYARTAGMMIPTKGRAAWILPEGTLPYCVLRLRKVEFDPEPQAGPAAIVRGLIRVQNVLHRASRCCERPERYGVSSPTEPWEGSPRGGH